MRYIYEILPHSGKPGYIIRRIADEGRTFEYVYIPGLAFYGVVVAVLRDNSKFVQNSSIATRFTHEAAVAFCEDMDWPLR